MGERDSSWKHTIGESNYFEGDITVRRKSRAEQDTKNYSLYQNNGFWREKVYDGISNDVDRRVSEHRRDGKEFNEVEVSRVRSRARAERDETEAIHSHQDSNLFGQPPRYNKAKVKKPDPSPFGFESQPQKRSRKNDGFGFRGLF